MNHRNKIVLFVIIVTLVIFAGLFVFNTNKKSKYSLVNITDLSENFMQNYYDGMERLQKNDYSQENILIVTSLNKIQDFYGAVDVVEAPNHQYILQYRSEKSKKAALRKFKKDNTIESVVENYAYTYQTDRYTSWGIEKMALSHAISEIDENNKNLQEVTVAIIDSGCDMDLFNKYYNGKISEVYNVLEDSTTNMSDEEGHGTHIAGIIAEGTPSNVKILPVKVSKVDDVDTYVPKKKGPYLTDIITSINYIVSNNKAQVINMSFADPVYDEALYQAIEAAKQKNIITVAAAGNVGGSNQKFYPAAFDNTISVAACDSNLVRYKNSSWGDTITFSAPGVDIKSIMGNHMLISIENSYQGNDNDDDHETVNGTSQAAPYVASAVAILKSYNNNLTLENVIDLLKEKTIDLGDVGWDPYYGYGFISFAETTFCDGENCDELGVYKLNKIVIKPNIIVKNKVFDGTTSIPLSNISISNLDSSEYSIVSALSSKADVGRSTAIIKIKLSDDKFVNYSFDNGKQEQEFLVDFEILKNDINVLNLLNNPDTGDTLFIVMLLMISVLGIGLFIYQKEFRKNI